MCSTIIFDVGRRKCLAQNYDYLLDHGLVAINLRDTNKSNGDATVEKGLEWVVKYGSISFNQFSLEMPVSGMNEAGLAIALMWHEEGEFGIDEDYLRLNSLQWIQYQLDNFENIDEVVKGLQTIRPEQGPVPLHFMLLDSQGDTLIVEFIGGELLLRKNAEYPILTNTSYDTCITVAMRDESSENDPLGNSVGRFAHLHRQLSKQTDKEYSTATGFCFLDSVSQTPNEDIAESFPWTKLENDTITAWSIVFDPAKKTILLKTDKNRATRSLNLDEISFDANSDYQVADINAGISGSMIPYFKPYSIDQNYEILKLSAPIVGLPGDAIEELVEAVDYLYRERCMP